MSTWSPAVAQAADDDAAALEMARQRFQEGVHYFDAKQYDKARAAFLQAYALKKHPTVLLNLAQSELRSSHEAEAAEHFSKWLRENKDADSGEEQSAEQGLAAAKKKVAEVSLAVDLPDAEVFVDDVSKGHAPLPGPVYLSPGTHTLQARKDGRVATSTVTASAGQSVSIALNFSNAARAARRPRPTGSGSSAQGGEVPPPSGFELGGGASSAAEDHGASEGFGTWYGHKPLAWVLTGVAGVGAAGGAVFAVSASKNYKDADSVASQINTAAREDGIPTQGLCVTPSIIDSLGDAQRQAAYRSACAKYKDNVDRGDKMKLFATVSFAVGGAAAVGTIVYYFVDSGSSSSTAANATDRGLARAVPIVAPGFIGIATSGTF